MSATEINPDRFFANLVERVSCALIDIVVVILLVDYLNARLPESLQSDLVRAAAGLLYFAGFWSSSLKATPAQLLFRLRVVDLGGNAVAFGKAALRALLVVGIFAGCVAIVGAPRNELMYVFSFLATSLLLMAAITPRRQAAHDLLAGSIVVRSRALTDPRFQSILDGLSERIASQPKWFKWIRWGDLIQTTILIGGGAFFIYTTAAISYSRELRARTAYAIFEVTSLKPVVHSFYLEHERLPQTSAELDLARRNNYPDGGYYEMDADGRFNIHFEKLPELVRGTITLTPVVTDGDIEWRCESHGEWVPGHLPSMCRNH